jgi:hypothetical protein
MKPEEKHQVTIKKGGKLITNDMPVKGIEYDAGYWRKANAVHKWFEDNCTSGDWNGEDVWVSRDQLKELLKLCKEVVAKAKVVKGQVQNGSTATASGWQPNMEDGEYIENAEEIAQILPTTDGFFFGSTDYDQWYLEDIKSTIEIITKALEADDTLDFYYSASW